MYLHISHGCSLSAQAELSSCDRVWLAKMKIFTFREKLANSWSKQCCRGYLFYICFCASVQVFLKDASPGQEQLDQRKRVARLAFEGAWPLTRASGVGRDRLFPSHT